MVKVEEGNNNLYPRCLVCQETPPTGLRGGVYIRKMFFCESCQQRILETQIDEPFYLQMQEGLKSLWQDPNQLERIYL